MSFFKDFKDDFSQAVNDLIPGEDDFAETEDTLGADDDLLVNTLDLEEVDTSSELTKLNGLLEQVTETPAAPSVEKPPRNFERDFTRDARGADTRMTMEDRKRMNEEMMASGSTKQVTGVNPDAISDEVTVITEGTNIKGDIASDGSVDIRGRIVGNVTCNGKLIITGILEGNSNSSEFFADAAKVEGEVNSTGTVKIGIGSVVIGNITASSAVIAGAIKGDIDVQGPVVVDTSAVVMGNIKSRSVQINNGAVIEGFCSQTYADIDVQSLFDEKKGN